MAQLLKNLLAMQELQETQVQSLGREDPLEKGMVTHSSILAWRIPWTEEPGALYSPRCRKDLDMTERQTNTGNLLFPYSRYYLQMLRLSSHAYQRPHSP